MFPNVEYMKEDEVLSHAVCFRVRRKSNPHQAFPVPLERMQRAIAPSLSNPSLPFLMRLLFSTALRSEHRIRQALTVATWRGWSW